MYAQKKSIPGCLTFPRTKPGCDVGFLFRVRSPHAAASMGAKNKQRRRKKGDKTVTFSPEEADMEAGNSGGPEDGETAAGGGQTKPSDGGEELSLDEVLRLGGTKVGPGPRSRTLNWSMSAWWSSGVTRVASSSVVVMTTSLLLLAVYHV